MALHPCTECKQQIGTRGNRPMRTFPAVALVFGLFTTPAQTNTARGQPVPATTTQKSTQPETAKPTPLSDGFIRPVTRAFIAIKESTDVAPQGPTPVDDRISEAGMAASTQADKAFVAAIGDYKIRKWEFNLFYSLAFLGAKIKAETGGNGVPYWECKSSEDRDVCPSYQAAVKTLLAADRDLAKIKIVVEDCEDSLENSLKTKLFGSAPACGNKSKPESK